MQTDAQNWCLKNSIKDMSCLSILHASCILLPSNTWHFIPFSIWSLIDSASWPRCGISPSTSMANLGGKKRQTIHSLDLDFPGKGQELSECCIQSPSDDYWASFKFMQPLPPMFFVQRCLQTHPVNHKISHVFTCLYKHTSWRWWYWCTFWNGLSMIPFLYLHFDNVKLTLRM